MAVASLRVVARSGGGSSGSLKGSGSRTGTGTDVYGNVTSAKGVNDITPIVKLEEARVTAMTSTSDNEAKASSLQRPLRAAIKLRVDTTTISRDVLMNSDTVTAVILDEVVKAFSFTPTVANSYLISRVYFPSTAKGSVPVKKRPVSVIMTTILHTFALLREFILKPFFQVLGFSYSQCPSTSRRSGSRRTCF